MQIVLFGGSNSGKSSLAEELVLHLAKTDQQRYYLATMQADGPEADERIKRHQNLREGKGFTTIERPLNLGELTLKPGSIALLECLGNLVANEMFVPHNKKPITALTLLGDIQCLQNQVQHLIIVSNEVGADGREYDALTRAYQDVLAELNCEISVTSDVAIEMVCGIPLFLKGAHLCPSFDRL